MRKVIVSAMAVATLFAQPALTAPITYGCDTPSDRFSAIEQQVSLQAFSIKGSIQPNEFRKGKYSPLAQIYLQSPDENYLWAMKIIALDHKAKEAFVFLEMTENGKESEPFVIGSVKMGEKLNFDVSITEGAKIKFKIGDMEGNPELSFGPTANLNIICSSGDFVFSNLEWSEK